MRRARVTYQGAFHHAMNRGFEGRPIFGDDHDKNTFVDLLVRLQELLKIRVLAYSMMSNHYHLILQNTSNRMDDFFKQLNGQFGQYYRKQHGGKGYVFQDRYKSMLIQDEGYLLMSIAYVLNNPVKAGLCTSFSEYPWSSGSLYFSGKDTQSIDCEYVESLINSEEELQRLVNGSDWDELPVIRTEMGNIIGFEDDIEAILKKSDRRSGKASLRRKRTDDKYFEPVEKIFYEFEKKYQLKIDKIDPRTYFGKRLRSELMVYLKERAGMRYRDIAELDIFAGLSINSLGPLYHRNKNRKF